VEALGEVRGQRPAAEGLHPAHERPAHSRGGQARRCDPRRLAVCLHREGRPSLRGPAAPRVPPSGAVRGGRRVDRREHPAPLPGPQPVRGGRVLRREPGWPVHASDSARAEWRRRRAIDVARSGMTERSPARLPARDGDGGCYSGWRDTRAGPEREP
jgi:hypothetical protein